MLFHPKKIFTWHFFCYMAVFLAFYFNTVSCGSKTSREQTSDIDEEYLAEPIPNSSAKGIIFLAEQVSTTGKLSAYFYDFKEGIITKLGEIVGYTAKSLKLSSGPSFLLSTLKELNLITFTANEEKDKRPFSIKNNIKIDLTLKNGEPFSAKSSLDDSIVITAPHSKQSWILDKDLQILSTLAEKIDSSVHSFRPMGLALDVNVTQTFMTSTALNISENFTITQESQLFAFQQSTSELSQFSVENSVALQGESPIALSLSSTRIYALSLCPPEADIGCKNGIDVISREDFSYIDFAEISEPLTSIGIFVEKGTGDFLAVTEESSSARSWVSRLLYTGSKTTVTPLFQAIGNSFSSFLMQDSSNGYIFTGEKSIQENQGILRIYTRDNKEINAYIPDIPVSGILIE